MCAAPEFLANVKFKRQPSRLNGTLVDGARRDENSSGVRVNLSPRERTKWLHLCVAIWYWNLGM